MNILHIFLIFYNIQSFLLENQVRCKGTTFLFAAWRFWHCLSLSARILCFCCFSARKLRGVGTTKIIVYYGHIYKLPVFKS